MSGALPLTGSWSLTKDFSNTRLEQLCYLYRIIIRYRVSLGVEMFRAVLAPSKLPRLSLAHA